MRLQVLRTAAGKTQAEVATTLGVGRMTVSHWEQGTYELAALDVPRLAEIYKVDVAVILGLAPMPLIQAGEP